MNAAPYKPSPQEAGRVIVDALPRVRLYLGRWRVHGVDADDLIGRLTIIGYRAVMDGRLAYDPDPGERHEGAVAYLCAAARNLLRNPIIRNALEYVDHEPDLDTIVGPQIEDALVLAIDVRRLPKDTRRILRALLRTGDVIDAAVELGMEPAALVMAVRDMVPKGSRVPWAYAQPLHTYGVGKPRRKRGRPRKGPK